MSITVSSSLGVSCFEDTEPRKLSSGASLEEVEIVIRDVYRQVLGNAHVMESERLTVAESQLKNREITVREFVAQVARSELYRSRFFDNYPRYRAIEFNFKHLLGRAPESQEEIQWHSQLFEQGGYQVEINSYLDSEEYQEAFGEDLVPYYRGYQTQPGRKVVGFTHLFQLLRGAASSSLSTLKETPSRLQRSLIANTPSSIVPLASPPPYEPLIGYKPITDTRQLIAKALGLKTQPTIAFRPTAANGDRYSSTDRARQSQYQSQYQALKDVAAIELLPGSSEEEVEIVIRAVYRQVLGNAHVMESERLTVAESQLKRGEISVREMIRRVAKSELYRSRFFDNCPRYRSIELNFKHLLGRAPGDYSETFFHSQVLDRGGLEAEIDSYIDSDEYQNAFGENIVPYYRGYQTQTGQKLLQFTNMFQLLPSVSTSDKAGESGTLPRLNRALIYNNPQGQAPITDVKELLAEVLKPKPPQLQPQVTAQVQVDRELQRKHEEQEKLIERLQQQLAELQPLAGIGTRELSKWQSFSPTTTSKSPRSTTSFSQPWMTQRFTPADNYQKLQSQIEEQENLIADLKARIADSQRFATIGELQLNKDTSCLRTLTDRSKTRRLPFA